MRSQLLGFIKKNDFNYLFRKYEGDKYVKQFTFYNQLAVLIFGLLFNREGPSNLMAAKPSHTHVAYHLGFGIAATRSNV